MSTQGGEAVVELTALVTEVTERLRDDFRAIAADLDLNPSQAIVVNRLTEPVPMRALAGWLSCEPSNVTNIVDGLERLGLVERRADPADRRVKQVVLTPEGERRRDLLHARGLAGATAFFDLDDAEKSLLRGLLTRLLRTGPS
ncbi:MarR family winged helix-turn-helix transcriptional regulator [Actinocorallia herbida]|nr:MarR family transcriptional regulator [Actinocorallia herbida]